MIISLRPWQREDAQALAALANNRNVFANVRDAFPQPYTVVDGLNWINLVKDKQPCQNFAIIYGQEVVGNIGCYPKEDVYRRTAEIGYFIGEHYWNKGIATRAVGLMVQYVREHFNLIRLYAEVFQHNVASMKVLQNNGFHLESIRRKAIIKNNVVLDDYVWVLFLK